MTCDVSSKQSQELYDSSLALNRLNQEGRDTIAVGFQRALEVFDIAEADRALIAVDGADRADAGRERPKVVASRRIR